VLQAPTGAGKTTLVPLALLEAEWLDGQTIVMLEPRRLAARAAAFRMAELRGEPIGETIGYRMRGDIRVGAHTRIEVVTEGILTRRLQRDPTLEGVGVVIFDEFHERSVAADLGLALTRRTQAIVRDDLRILIMSATLDGDAVAALLDDAPIITSEGRAYPVETRYVAPRINDRMETSVAGAVFEALRRDEGDILVFLPGAGEIRRVMNLLDARSLDDVAVRPLFAAMSASAQDEAIRLDPRGRRKIVLATAIAETSLTIEGVRVVIDSGASRSSSFSPRTGMTRLETARVSRASADQRRGRAGRLSPGVCYRLWPAHENALLLSSTPPEITRADLAPVALDLLAAGVRDPNELDWITPPTPAAYAQALGLLRELEAVDDTGITAHGRAMNELPVHPRLGHMLLRARDLGVASLACEVAALLSERDVLRGLTGVIDADIGFRLNILRGGRATSVPLGADVDRAALLRARRDADRLARQLGIRRDRAQPVDLLGVLVALAYPDRIAQRRDGDRPRYVLRNGRGAELTGQQTLARSPYLVAADLDDRGVDSRVFLAAAVDLDDILSVFRDQITEEDAVEFDSKSTSVVARRRKRLGAIVLAEIPLAHPDPLRIAAAMLAEVRRRGLASLPWSGAARRLRQRMAFVARHDPRWPDVSDQVLTTNLEMWLGAAVVGNAGLALDAIDLTTALNAMLDWKQRRALDELAPTHVTVPSGSRILLDYANSESPALAVRIQEVFGLDESPRVMLGRVPVTMHLLSPAYRPVQVTQDLSGFWRMAYFDVRKDLRGRYPKHHWPDNPLGAKPTTRTKGK
jgi:ATP-dependent helicase HrpB